jgi:CDP-diacylglycerol--serine O-phosphatidyltransferase
MPKVRRRRREDGQIRRGFYLIPSLFTVANIFCGFLSIVASSRGEFERSAILILIAIFADVLDGRIARLTGTASQFGEEFDSLADVVSFGVAPSLLAFQWGLWEVPRIGMAVSFLLLVAGAIRLARFSAKHSDSVDFVGLPIPAAAGSVAMVVLLSPTPVTHPAFIPVVVAFVLGLSLLMVSNLPYPSFKAVNLRKKWPAPALFLIALVFSLVTLTPHFLSILAAVYILSAPVTVLTRKARRRGRPKAKIDLTTGDEHVRENPGP